VPAVIAVDATAVTTVAAAFWVSLNPVAKMSTVTGVVATRGGTVKVIVLLLFERTPPSGTTAPP
jgi:hypothetical protein